MAQRNENGLFGAPRVNRRGFLIMVVVGVLAVMLAICVGFLSYTRGEVNSVATIRDKNDGYDICVSAQDFLLGAIMTDLMDSGGNFDQTKYVSAAQDGQWWYRPNQKGLGNAIKSWWGEGTLRPYFHAKSESDFCYLPVDFFGEGGVRGRYQVLIMDANSVLNINDWNEDCSPTQCQMAHMIAEAYGDNILERYRAFRDNGVAGWNGYGTYTPLRYHEAWRAATRTTRYMDWPNWYSQGIDNEAGDYWLTTNQSWLGLYGPDYACIRATVPSDGFPMYDGTSSGRLPSTISLTTVAGSTNYQPPDFPVGSRAWRPTVPGGYGNRHYDTGGLGWGLSGMGLMGYTDPDTGRTPVNVNTCYNSGEILPMETYTPNAVRPCHTMEAVFNIEALRRIIKVGVVYASSKDPGTNGKIGDGDDVDGPGPDGDQSTAGDNTQLVPVRAGDVYAAKDSDAFPELAPGSGWINVPLASDPTNTLRVHVKQWDVIRKIEDMRTKLAYQYQETLCRYFTGTYKHGNFNAGLSIYSNNRRFPCFKMDSVTTRNSFTPNMSYIQTYRCDNPGITAPKKQGALSFVEASKVQYGCTNMNYTATRFPYSLQQFRDNVMSDLKAMTENNRNVAGINVNPADYPLYTGCGVDGEETVSFDMYDIPEIVPGKLDKRTASAVFDNIVPGKVYLFNVGEITSPNVNSVRDPLGELDSYKLARQEDMNDPYNVYARWDDNPNLRAMAYQGANHKNHLGADQDLNAKGKDIAANTDANGNPVPPGPYDRIGKKDDHLPPSLDSDQNSSPESMTNIPYRQRIFTSDGFSTELTTTSTTFIMIINAQLVDNQTVKMNPADPTKHRDLFWNQWGIVVEICPDVTNENAFADYYADAKPKFYKTAVSTSPDGMDYKCPSLRSRNLGDGTIGSPFERDQTTYVKDWQADIRGVKGGDEAAFYTGTKQTKKRVVVRSIWSLNQGIMR